MKDLTIRQGIVVLAISVLVIFGWIGFIAFRQGNQHCAELEKTKTELAQAKDQIKRWKETADPILSYCRSQRFPTGRWMEKEVTPEDLVVALELCKAPPGR